MSERSVFMRGRRSPLWCGEGIGLAPWGFLRGLALCAAVVRLIKRETRASGGCLGTERRRRTWHAAKSPGEMRAIGDPGISEWGNPPVRVSCAEFIGAGGEPGELKHLSNRRNRHQPRFRQ